MFFLFSRGGGKERDIFVSFFLREGGVSFFLKERWKYLFKDLFVIRLFFE